MPRSFSSCCSARVFCAVVLGIGRDEERRAAPRDRGRESPFFAVDGVEEDDASQAIAGAADIQYGGDRHEGTAEPHQDDRHALEGPARRRSPYSVAR